MFSKREDLILSALQELNHLILKSEPLQEQKPGALAT